MSTPPAKRQIKLRRRYVSVETLMMQGEIDRGAAIRIMKALDAAGFGALVKGVRGYPTRLEII